MPARLHLLAELPAGREHRRAGDARVRASWSACSSAATRRSSACATPSSGRRFARLARAPGRAARCCARSRWLVRALGRAAAARLALRAAAAVAAGRAAAAVPDRAPHAGRARHRADDAARDRGGRHLHGRAADQPARDRRAAARRQHGARHRARHPVGRAHRARQGAARDRLAVVRRPVHASATCVFLLCAAPVAEAVALAAGLAITEISMQIIKRAVERPRPGGRARRRGRLRLPSGHAALSVTFLAIGGAARARGLPTRHRARAGRAPRWRSRSASRASTCGSTT